jgi:hypothetical protein
MILLLACSSASARTEIPASTQPPHPGNPIIFYGMGGGPMPVGGTASIRLIEQEVRVELPSRRTFVRSVLQNDDKPVTLEIGVYESGSTLESGVLPRGGFFRDYRALIDGKRLKISHRRFKTSSIAGDEYEDEYSLWWIAQAHFAHGQKRVMKLEYTAGRSAQILGAPECGTQQYFVFDLQSAAAWKGAVKKLRVVFDIAGLRDFSEIEFQTPRGFTRKANGSSVVWEAQSIEPRDAVGADWYPGVHAFEVNGEAPLERCIVVGKERQGGEYPAVYPVRKNGKIWVPMRLLQQWFAYVKDRESKSNDIVQSATRERAGLNVGVRNIVAMLGKSELEASENGTVLGHFKMSAPAYREKGVTMIELAPAMQALGGRITLKNGVTRLWLE